MKKFYKAMSIAAALLMAGLLSGCGGGSSTTTSTEPSGTVALSLTDAPADNEAVSAVYVTFDSVQSNM